MTTMIIAFLVVAFGWLVWLLAMHYTRIDRESAEGRRYQRIARRRVRLMQWHEKNSVFDRRD